MINEFRAFAFKGNVVDLAIGIIIGAAFTTIVTSLVNDIIMPPIGLIFDADFQNVFMTLRDGTPAGPYQTLEAAEAAGAITWNIGSFTNAVIAFLIVAIVLFLILRPFLKSREKAEALALAEAAAEAKTQEAALVTLDDDAIEKLTAALQGRSTSTPGSPPPVA